MNFVFFILELIKYPCPLLSYALCRQEFQVNQSRFIAGNFVYLLVDNATCAEKSHLGINDVPLWHLGSWIDSRVTQLDRWRRKRPRSHKSASSTAICGHTDFVADCNIIPCCYFCDLEFSRRGSSSAFLLGF